MALYVRFGCNSDTDSNRAMPTARETSKAQTLRNTGPSFFVAILHVGSQESVLEVPTRGQLHAAIRVTRKRCDSCAQDGIAAKLLRCGIASDVLRRNMPLRSGSA